MRVVWGIERRAFAIEHAQLSVNAGTKKHALGEVQAIRVPKCRA